MQDQQAERAGVVGYISGNSTQFRDQIATDEVVHVRFEPGNDSISFRIKSADIVDVVDGSMKDGEQRVHVLLSPGAVVETAVKMFRDVAAIEDPTLSRLTAVSEVSVSFV